MLLSLKKSTASASFESGLLRLLGWDTGLLSHNIPTVRMRRESPITGPRGQGWYGPKHASAARNLITGFAWIPHKGPRKSTKTALARALSQPESPKVKPRQAKPPAVCGLYKQKQAPHFEAPRNRLTSGPIEATLTYYRVCCLLLAYSLFHPW